MFYCDDKKALRKNRLGSNSKNSYFFEGYIATIQCRNKSLLFCVFRVLLVPATILKKFRNPEDFALFLKKEFLTKKI